MFPIFYSLALGLGTIALSVGLACYLTVRGPSMLRLALAGCALVLFAVLGLRA